MKDLNATSIEGAMLIIAEFCRSMSVEVSNGKTMVSVQPQPCHVAGKQNVSI
jgi:hypothetical protein